MSVQRHVIKRQVLEVNVTRTIDPQRLQTELSRIYRQRLLPLIDQYCTALSAPDRLHRISRLEIDLGRVDLPGVEEALVAAINTQFKTLLAEQISVQEHSTVSPARQPKIASQLELFSLFAQTGSLPWWADTAQPRLLTDCLHYLVRQAPAALRHVLHELVQQEQPLQRLVAHYDDALLADLVGLLTPAMKASLPQLPQALIASVQRTAARLGRSPTRIRQHVWHSLLAVASLQGSQSPDTVDVYREALVRMAAALGVTYATLVFHLQQVMPDGEASAHRQFRELCVTLAHELAERTGLPGALKAAPGLEAVGPEGQASPPALWQVPGGPPAVQDDPTWQTATRHRATAARDDRSPSQWPTASPVDLRFSDADEVYIDNAGLVILWPFLGHFFARLGLVENGQFTDSAARHRAVALLQYVATEDLAPPEYLLTLNKVLCGMAPDEVWMLDTPLTEAEIEECSALLSAVVAHAPILHNMSLPGLRGTFVLRRGQLSARDGAWLLRVERVTYDVVLDRFPWSVAWVKLPWMDTPLQVEW